MVYAQPSNCHEEWDTQTPLGFWRKNGSLNLGQTNKPHNNQQKKERTCKIEDFALSADHRLKLKENKKKEKYLDLAMDLEDESDCYTKCNWCSCYSHQRIIKGFGNKWTSGDHPNYYIIEIGQNTEKSPNKYKMTNYVEAKVYDTQ